MKFIFISLLVVIYPWFAHAQFDTPNVPNAVGFDLPMGNSSFTISIGEPVITTLTSSSTFITQGYLQPIDKTPCESVELIYYPNPAREHLFIEVSGCDDEILSVQIIDLWGRVLDTVVPNENNQIQLEQLSQGLYVFKVLLKGGTSGNFSAIKVSN